MIIIINIGESGGDAFSYTRFTKDGAHVVLDGTFHVIARFEVVEKDDDGDISVVQEVKA